MGKKKSLTQWSLLSGVGGLGGRQEVAEDSR